MRAVFLPGCFHTYAPFTGTNITIVPSAERPETAAVVPEGGSWFPWSINHSLARNCNNNRNLSGILSFSLSDTHGRLHSLTSFEVSSWTADGVLECSSWLHSTPSSLLSGERVCVPVCASACVWTFTTFSCHSVLFCFCRQKAGQLGVLSSREPRCPAVIQFPSQSPLLEQYSFTTPNKRAI